MHSLQQSRDPCMLRERCRWLYDETKEMMDVGWDVESTNSIPIPMMVSISNYTAQKVVPEEGG